MLFQTARPSPEATPGDPQIWRPDGTVAPFLGPLAENQWYRLHDVAEITPAIRLADAVRRAEWEDAP